jgi:twitching motility protein PilT
VSDDLTLLARIAIHYQLVTAEQVAECMQAPIAKRGLLGTVLFQRGYISAEQLEWLKQAEAHYAAHQATPTAPASAPTAPAIPGSSGGPRDTMRSAPREIELTNEPTLEIDAASVPAQASARAEYRKRHHGDAPTAAPRPDAKAGASALEPLLTDAVSARASDVHLHAGEPPLARIHGELAPLPGGLPLAPADTDALVRAVLTDEQRARFAKTNDIDFAWSLPGVGRFRVNAYRQQRGVDLVFRAIPPVPPSLEELGLAEPLARFTEYHQGLVLCTGPAGCGKSTTMAALLRRINEQRADHIITIEDPIEFVHKSGHSLVRQRQVARHTESFARALRAALREDPDVIAIGELRDLETIQLALSAAETGHLVLATLHTQNAIRTINRVLDAFPPAQQSQVRIMFSEALRGVISQRLVRRADGQGRVAALELLVMTPAVSNLIREERQFQIRSLMQTGRTLGMRLLDDSLRELVAAGTITKEEARLHSESAAAS